MEEVFHFVVPDSSGNIRLDTFCTAAISGMTRSKLKTGLQTVLLNGKHTKLSALVRQGDRITLNWKNPVPDSFVPENIPLDILFEDEQVIVVNKQAGMVTHPAAGNWTGTLAQALAYYRLRRSPIYDAFAQQLEAESGLKNFNDQLRTGIVHRLDKPTSGVLITARTAAAEAFLKNEFKQRRTDKYYIALLYGIPKEKTGLIETAVFRSGKRRFAASADFSKGKYARSRYKIIKVYGEYALTVFKIYTGRTHQIRLHARFIGCPIAGDTLYGKKKGQGKQYGLMLHAYRLRVKLPSTGVKAVFTAPLPRRFYHLLRAVKAQEKGTASPYDTY